MSTLSAERKERNRRADALARLSVLTSSTDLVLPDHVDLHGPVKVTVYGSIDEANAWAKALGLDPVKLSHTGNGSEFHYSGDDLFNGQWSVLGVVKVAEK